MIFNDNLVKQLRKSHPVTHPQGNLVRSTHPFIHPSCGKYTLKWDKHVGPPKLTLDAK